MKKTKRRELSKRQNWALLVLAIAIVVTIAGLVYASANGKQNPTTTPSPSPTPSASSGAEASVAPGHAINPGVGSTSTRGSGSIPTPTPVSSLPAPTGELYSTKPPVSLSANPLEESVCQTTPEAACDIVLVSPSGQQVPFAAPAAGDPGGHLIDWYLKKYIGSTGDWKIFSRASLNGETSDSPQYDFQVTQ